MPKTTAERPTVARMQDTPMTPEPGVALDARTAAPAPADPPQVKAQSLSPRARKAVAEKAAAAKKPAKAASAKDGKGAKPRFEHKPKGPDLREDLRAFVQAQPGGWRHEDWVAFLDHLAARGHDTRDPEAVGLLLERERLAARLEAVQGMGPRRVQTLVDRYETIWSAAHAGADELAALPGMNRSLGEKVRQALHA